MGKKSELAFCLLLLVVASFFHFWNLGSGVIHDDEAIYSQVAREAVENKNPLIFTWKGNVGLGRDAVWLEKPPLLIWMLMALGSASDWSPFWLRFPSAIFGVGTVFLTYILVRHITGDFRWGIAAGTMLSITQPFVQISRLAQIDSMMTFFVLLATFGLVRAIEKPAWWYLFWVSTALVVLAKSAEGLLPIVFLVLYILLRRQFVLLRTNHFWRGVLAFVLIALPWHAYAFSKEPLAMWEQYVSYHVVQRAFVTLDGHVGGFAFYIDFLRFAYPFLLPVAAAGLYLIWRWRVISEAVRIIIIASVAPLVLLSFAATKITWYLHPLYPFFAAVFAIGFFHAWQSLRSFRHALLLGFVPLLTLTAAASLQGVFNTALIPEVRGSDEAAIGRTLQQEPPSTPIYMLSKRGISHTAVFYADRTVHRIEELGAVPEPKFYLITGAGEGLFVSPDMESTFGFSAMYSSDAFSLWEVRRLSGADSV
jgi:4-amino-4-deoxy-L-arabinose transferase-like glycosyltransferase